MRRTDWLRLVSVSITLAIGSTAYAQGAGSDGAEGSDPSLDAGLDAEVGVSAGVPQPGDADAGDSVADEPPDDYEADTGVRGDAQVDLQVRAEVGAPAPEPSAGSSLAEDLRLRQSIKPWHVALGTATGIATSLTAVLGWLTYADRYGFDGTIGGAGCGRGDPILGNDLCSGYPIPHGVLAVTQTVLFSTTFALALGMPDPLGVDQGNGELASLLRVHKAIRWTLMSLMVVQIALGLVTTSLDTSDFATQRGVATAHLVVGNVTWAAMVTQGVLGSMMEW